MTKYHEAVLNYTTSITALDVERYVACFAENCQLDDPVGAPVAQGKDAARAFFNGFLPVIAKIEMRPGKIYVNGQKAAFNWTMDAVGKQGQPAAADGIDTLEFNDAGEIVKISGYWDPGPFVAALTK